MSWTTYTVYNFADDLHWPELGILLESIETVSPEGTFCDTVQVPSNGGDMELI